MSSKIQTMAILAVLLSSTAVMAQDAAAPADAAPQAQAEVEAVPLVTDIQQYDNGGIYEGEFRNGVQHGQGTYRLPNGYQYTGEWVDGEIRGQGRATFPDGSIYEGAFIMSTAPRGLAVSRFPMAPPTKGTGPRAVSTAAAPPPIQMA